QPGFAHDQAGVVGELDLAALEVPVDVHFGAAAEHELRVAQHVARAHVAPGGRPRGSFRREQVTQGALARAVAVAAQVAAVAGQPLGVDRSELDPEHAGALELYALETRALAA